MCCQTSAVMKLWKTKTLTGVMRVGRWSALRSISHHTPWFKPWLTALILPIQAATYVWMLSYSNRGPTVWEVQVSPEGQHWSWTGRFGYRPRGHQGIDISAWTNYRQQSPMAGFTETLCKGQYHRALYHALIISGIPLWLSDSTPAGLMRGMLVTWSNLEPFLHW